MKRVFYTLIILLLVTLGVKGQAPDIVHLHTQNHNQSITESTPVIISDSEIIIFYVSPERDTIYSTKSNNKGKQKFLSVGS